MSNLTTDILKLLKQQKIPGLELGDEFIAPAYGGLSILNLPATLCRLFGIPAVAGNPFDERLLAPLEQTLAGDPSIRNVILIVMDGLAYHRLQRWLDDGSAPVWQRLSEQGLLAPITSIVPSTTASALAGLWTGQPTARHAITGYEMWLKEYGLVANMILHSPMAFPNETGSLVKAGFNPETFLSLPMLGAHLAAHGIRTHALQHKAILNSGLSQMMLKGMHTQAFLTASDLWINARRLLEERLPERQYLYVYWGELDTLGHPYGPDDERPAAEFAQFSAALQHYFLERLPADLQRQTALILTADHGMISTQPYTTYDLKNHPELLRRLHILPTGENRLAYLYVRPGQKKAVREYIEQAWPDQFVVLETAQAIAGGLFGPGTPSPELRDRTGDLVVAARGNAYWWWSNKKNHMLGRHGGLSEEEMVVPLVAGRLDVGF